MGILYLRGMMSLVKFVAAMVTLLSNSQLRIYDEGFSYSR